MCMHAHVCVHVVYTNDMWTGCNKVVNNIVFKIIKRKCNFICICLISNNILLNKNKNNKINKTKEFFKTNKKKKKLSYFY